MGRVDRNSPGGAFPARTLRFSHLAPPRFRHRRTTARSLFAGTQDQNMAQVDSIPTGMATPAELMMANAGGGTERGNEKARAVPAGLPDGAAAREALTVNVTARTHVSIGNVDRVGR